MTLLATNALAAVLASCKVIPARGALIVTYVLLPPTVENVRYTTRFSAMWAPPFTFHKQVHRI